MPLARRTRRTVVAGAPGVSRGRRGEQGDWFLLTVAALGTALLAGVILVQGVPKDLVTLVVLTLLVLVIAGDVEHETGAQIGMSLSSIVLVASTVLVGPVGSGLATYLSPFMDRRPITHAVRAFDCGMYAIISVLPALLYERIGERPSAAMPPAQILLHVGLPMVAVMAVHLVLNALVLGAAVHLRGGETVWRYAWHMLRDVGLNYLSGSVVAFLFVILWMPVGVGPFAAVLVLAPILVARWALARHAGEQQARERAVQTFVAALDSKGSGSSEHSARQARLAGALARDMELGRDTVTAVEYAARLFDVGVLALPADEVGDLVEQAGRRRPAERMQLRLRIARLSAELIEGVDFLEPARRVMLAAARGEGSPEALAVSSAIGVERRLWLAERRGDDLLADVLGWLDTPGQTLEGIPHPDPGGVAALRRVLPQVLGPSVAAPAEGPRS